MIQVSYIRNSGRPLQAGVSTTVTQQGAAGAEPCLSGGYSSSVPQMSSAGKKPTRSFDCKRAIHTKNNNFDKNDKIAKQASQTCAACSRCVGSSGQWILMTCYCCAFSTETKKETRRTLAHVMCQWWEELGESNTLLQELFSLRTNFVHNFTWMNVKQN